VDSIGTQANGQSANPAISGDGRYVTFYSAASTLVAGDSGFEDVFVHDRQTGNTTRISVDSIGTQANGQSANPAISGDGRYVTFQSQASNLVAAGDSEGWDAFVHDRQTGNTTRVSHSSLGAQANDD
jgi:Tol biopolymer transport system component